MFSLIVLATRKYQLRKRDPKYLSGTFNTFLAFYA